MNSAQARPGAALSWGPATLLQDPPKKESVAPPAGAAPAPMFTRKRKRQHTDGASSSSAAAAPRIVPLPVVTNGPGGPLDQVPRPSVAPVPAPPATTEAMAQALAVPCLPFIACTICQEPAAYPIAFPCAEHHACFTCIVEMVNALDIQIECVTVYRKLAPVREEPDSDSGSNGDSPAKTQAQQSRFSAKPSHSPVVSYLGKLQCPLCQGKAEAFSHTLEKLKPLPTYAYTGMNPDGGSRTYTCLYCPKVGSLAVLTRHLLDECRSVQFRCNFCRRPFLRGLRDQHIRKECDRLPCTHELCVPVDEEEEQKSAASSAAGLQLQPMEPFRGTWSQLVSHSRLHDELTTLEMTIDKIRTMLCRLRYGSGYRSMQRDLSVMIQDFCDFSVRNHNRLWSLAANTLNVTVEEYMSAHHKYWKQHEEEDDDDDEEDDDEDDEDEAEDEAHNPTVAAAPSEASARQ